MRLAGAGLLAVAAIIVWFALAPAELPETSDVVANEISAILAEAELNEQTAEGAPQQQVINGWVARDLLEVVATQGTDRRTGGLALVGVLGILLAVATTRPHPRSR